MNNVNLKTAPHLYGVENNGFPDGLTRIVKDKKFGYIDKTGEVVIQPQFNLAWAFSEGLARVKVDKGYGYIDKTGKYIWEPTI